ncbi:MAG: 2-dehydro-3-deoxygalactonokinase [Boseongicola sp.]|nr:2-dehydro-3-deoxygalactonokinase [Boseongicola sp.]
MSAETKYADWIAVDWGTSSLRAWAMRGKTPVAEARSDRGMGALQRHEFEPALLDLIDPWLGQGRTAIVACGMVGSRQGWTEAAYTAVPCTPAQGRPVRASTDDPRIAVHILPGLKQPDPADVMRGEETQIAGHLAAEPGFDGVVCMPGTHTKWVHISAGEVVSFRTFMTGEIFALLSRQSVLRHSVGEGWDDDAFQAAVSDAIARPEATAATLFNIRADGLLNAPAPDAARARLSGLLIGAELAAARPYWLGQDVVLIGNAGFSQRYAQALTPQGLTPRISDATEATLRGLARAHDALEKALT